MKTTRKLLPAINSLYDMNFTNEELTSLTSHWAANTEKPEETEEENKGAEREYKVKRDLKISMRKADIILTATSPWSIDFDKDQNINIQKLDLEDKQSDKELATVIKESTIYTTFGGRIGDSSTSFKFKEFKESDVPTFTSCVNFLNNFRNLEKSLAVLYSNLYIYKDVNEFKNILQLEILKNFLSLNTKFEAAYGVTIAQFRSFVKDIFPTAEISKGTLTKEMAKMLHMDGKLRHIQTVIEVKNHRIALSLKSGDSYYSEKLDVSFSVVPHTDPAYNYVDPDRLWYRQDRRYSYHEAPPKAFGDAMFINEDPPIPKPDVLKDHLAGDREETEFIGNQDLLLITKRYTQKQNRLRAEEVAKEKLEQKISDKLAQLRTSKGSLKINDVVYTKDVITYQDQILKNTDGTSDWVYNLLRRQVNSISLNRVTFDHVFGAFVGGVRRDKDYSPIMDSGHIGDVTFDITSQTLTNRNNISSTRFYINGFRINTAEIPECIERAICYETQEDYNHFLKSVSSCSLKMHRYLQLGIDIRVRDDFDYTQVTLKFPLERLKNLNYLVINETEYKVRDTNKIIRLERAENIMEVINVLLSGEVVEGVEATDIKDIIEAGKQEYIDAVEKSKQLLKEAEETLKIISQNIELKDGTQFTGYLVKGDLRTYAVNAHDDRHSVYDYDTAQYICIVDKTNNAQVGKDRLVNRLFALANDKLVATKISTLKRSNNNG